MNVVSSPRFSDTLIAVGGDAGRLISGRDWSATSLGDLESWRQSLRTVLTTLLASPVPMVMLWGEDGVMLYNDAYSVFAGGRHPELLGSKVREGWPEVADFNDNVMRVGLAGGTLNYSDQELTLYRHGRAEQVFMNLDYSPVFDESGAPAGVLAIVVETSQRVMADRRQAFRLQLERALRELDDPVAIMSEATATLGQQLGVAQVGFGEIDEAQTHVTVHRDWNDGRIPSVVGTWRMEDFGEAFVALMKAGQTSVIADVRDDPRTSAPKVVAAYDAITTRSLVDVPLVRGGRMVAMLFVHHPEPRAWSVEDVALVEETSARLWAAVGRARAEAALAESAERLQLAVDNAEVGFWDVDAVNGQLIWPPRTKAMFGISADVPVTMQDFYDGLHPDDQAATSAAYTAAGDPQVRAIYDVEYRTVGREDGVIRWISAKGRGVFDGDGTDARCLRVAGTVIEITARKAAEERLRESEARLRAVIDAAPVGLMFATRDGAISGSNKRVEELLRQGIVKSARVADYAGDYLAFHGDGRQVASDEHPMARALAGETRPELECRVQRGDGTLAWVRYVASAIRDINGALLGAVVASLDIDKEKRLAETLEQRVRDAIADRDRTWNNARDLLLVISGDGVFRAVNPAWTALLGWPADKLVGRSYLDFIHSDDHPSSRNALHVATQTELSVYENRYRHQNGSYRTISWVAAPEGDLVFASGRDVTAEKARQLELELAQEALRQAQKMEAMGQLTGGVAHDFNNLLTPIVGSLDMLQRKGLGNEREQRLIAGAMESAERAKTLVQRLLAFARRQPLQPVPVDLAKLVRSMGDLIESTTGPQIRVAVDASDDLPPALADPNQLEMALLNLAVNARDAMADGGSLRISASAEKVSPGHRSQLPGGEYVRLSVADSGAGMDEATLARATEPFFSTKGVGKGTGLGLSMVHGLASQLGGVLTIQSRPGLGTNVELWLPRSAAMPTTAVAAQAHAPASLSRGTALLVDDEELVRISTADMLIDLGYAVTEAASGEEAMRLIKRGERFDLLITDHLMPGITGTDLALAVRTAMPKVPVLLVSAYAEREGIDPDLPRLIKPFRKHELASSLAQLAKRD